MGGIFKIVFIQHLEAANLLVGFKLWAHHWRNSKLTCWCDNLAVVHAFTVYKIRDAWLMACVRNIWQITASFNIKLVVKHISGCENTYADIIALG